MRKEKSSNSYRKHLEDHVAYLEASLIKLKNNTDNDERQGILDAMSISDVVLTTNCSDHTNLSNIPDIRSSVSLFFKWLYPNQFVFIYREAFLSAFLKKQTTGSQYCSEELIYSIAAIGASMNNKNDPLYAKANEYYNIAKEKVLQKLFQEELIHKNSSSLSKLVLIQSLLCLAFYSINNGNNEMAWYFSGFAFRIVHEIGLHLNSDSWSYNEEEQDQRSSENLSQYDTEVRSRIYWGCYLADNLISQLFGRVTTLSLSNSTVPETDELPDISGIEEFMHCPEREPVLVVSPVKNLIILSRITSWFINKIFIRSHSLNERMENLTKFNIEMANWRTALPDEIQWSREAFIIEKYYDPTICCVWYHYYMALLSYNKPFVSNSTESRQLIENSIEDLYHILENWKLAFKTFEKCSLYMVYSAILAIQCMETGSIKMDYHRSFSEFLSSLTLNYALPVSLTEPLNRSTEEALSSSNFFDTYNPDFSLLNEINLLLDIGD